MRKTTVAIEEFKTAFENTLNADKDALQTLEQDATSPIFQYYLINEIKTDILLTSDVAIDDMVINVTAGHGFTGASGEVLEIWEGDTFAQLNVVSVATNAITVDIPLANSFTKLGAAVTRGNKNMNVNGSVTPVEYTFRPRNGAVIPIDLTGVIITMQHGANVPDDGKFGGIAAITNGVYFRQTNGTRVNLGNYRVNKDFKDRGGVVVYSDKAPAGTNATEIRFTFKNIFGQVIRIDPRVNSYMLGKVRDDISATAGMSGFTISFIGSYTEGE